MKTLASYENGNCLVELFEDGTKIVSYEEEPKYDFPNNLDIKITNYCDLGCKFCFESSTKAGVHGDLNVLFQKLSPLPSGVEIAIGGGNPTAHPDLVDFLVRCKEKGWIVNITVNQGHLKPFWDDITSLIDKELVRGIGLSITSSNFSYVKRLKEKTQHVIYHLIAGVHEPIVIDEILEFDDFPKLLVLGYKKFGFGNDFYSKEVDEKIAQWRMYVSKYFEKGIVSFDNLGIEQLKIKRFLTDEGWEKYFFGEDFTFSFYIDAVEKKFSPTSRSIERIDWNETTIMEYIKTFSEKSCH
jgi:hypothetical protein